MDKESKNYSDFQREGWTCKKCTFNNLSAIPNCEMCMTARDIRWVCNNCTFINTKIGKCQTCGVADDKVTKELYMERPKVMRYPDGSWDCPKCTKSNDAPNEVCSKCGIINEVDMILDLLDGGDITEKKKYIRPSRTLTTTRDEHTPAGLVLLDEKKTYQVFIIDCSVIRVIIWNRSVGIRRCIAEYVNSIKAPYIREASAYEFAVNISNAVDEFKRSDKFLSAMKEVRQISPINDVIVIVVGPSAISTQDIFKHLSPILERELGKFITLPPFLQGQDYQCLLSYTSLSH